MCRSSLSPKVCIISVILTCGCVQSDFDRMAWPVSGDPGDNRAQDTSLGKLLNQNCTLFFAGEATFRQDAYTVHGAFTSGYLTFLLPAMFCHFLAPFSFPSSHPQVVFSSFSHPLFNPVSLPPFLSSFLLSPFFLASLLFLWPSPCTLNARIFLLSNSMFLSLPLFQFSGSPSYMPLYPSPRSASSEALYHSSL